MANNLTSKLGSKFAIKQNSGVGEEVFSFPDPEAIALVNEKFLGDKIRAGYRSPYLLEFARRVESGDLNLETWKDMQLTTDELFDYVVDIKGVGPYAAGNLLKLLGHYDYLAIDSWCRMKFFELHKGGRKVSDKTIEKFYK